MSSWSIRDAKARFSEMLDASIEKGPQIVTRWGVETAVLVPTEEWRCLQCAAPPCLKTVPLSRQPRFEHLIPRHRKVRRRAPVDFQCPGSRDSMGARSFSHS